MSDEIKDNIVGIVSLLFGGIATILGGVLAWRKWHPEKQNLTADLLAKYITMLDNMTNLYSEAMVEIAVLRKENAALKKRH